MQQVALARFTVVDSSSQEAIARLGDADLDVTARTVLARSSFTK